MILIRFTFWLKWKLTLKENLLVWTKKSHIFPINSTPPFQIRSVSIRDFSRRPLRSDKTRIVTTSKKPRRVAFFIQSSESIFRIHSIIKDDGVLRVRNRQFTYRSNRPNPVNLHPYPGSLRTVPSSGTLWADPHQPTLGPGSCAQTKTVNYKWHRRPPSRHRSKFHNYGLKNQLSRTIRLIMTRWYILFSEILSYIFKYWNFCMI